MINYAREKNYISPWNITYFNETIKNILDSQIWSSIHTYIHIYLHLNICIHEYVSTYITPIYTCILTKHEYMYKYIFSYVNTYIHIHKYIYVNAYMLHTYCNKPHVLTNNNTCIKITYMHTHSYKDIFYTTYCTPILLCT